MATHSTQKRPVASSPDGGIMSRVSIGARQFMCGLSGHDSLRHFEQGRLSLKCVSCGHETPGWEVGTVPPRRETTAGWKSVVRVRLIGQRRAA